MATVSELRAQIAALEEAEKTAAREAYRIVKESATLEWAFERKPFGFRISCRYDEPSRLRVAEYKRQFPNAVTINFREPDVWQGMEYLLLYTKAGEPVLYSRGGYVILTVGGFKPDTITREQAEMFERGEIPEELKKPW